MFKRIKGLIENAKSGTFSARKRKRKSQGGPLLWLNRLVLLALAGFFLVRWWHERQEQAGSPVEVEVEEEEIQLDRYVPGMRGMEETSEQPRTAPVEVPAEFTKPDWPTPEVALSQAETAPVAASNEPQTAEAAREHPADQAERDTVPTRLGAEPPSQSSQPDDLTVLEGIGPKISSVLQEAGITTYRQLAETDIIKLQEILRNANLRLADPSTWPEQARLLDSGHQEEYQNLIEQLKAGRRT